MTDSVEKTEEPQAASDLFHRRSWGPTTLANRIVMAPLTRSRARPDGVPTALSWRSTMHSAHPLA